MLAGSSQGTRRRTRGRFVAWLVLLASAGLTVVLVDTVGALCACAVMAGVTAVAAVWALVWAEHRQTLYRRRLAAHSMHAHDGRPCYGDCLDRAERAA